MGLTLKEMRAGVAGDSADFECFERRQRSGQLHCRGAHGVGHVAQRRAAYRDGHFELYSRVNVGVTASLLSHLSDYCDYVLHPREALTFPSPLPQRALDFVFLPAGCTDVRCEVVPSLLSDHRPVVVDFELR